jgi:hypothetical protein
MAAKRVSVAMVWVTPYKPLLGVPWVNKQLASSDFICGTRKKAADGKYGKKRSWGDILTPFFYPQLLKIAATMAS